MVHKTKNLAIAFIVSLLTMCGIAITAYAVNCDLTCPNCGSKEINHFHPNGEKGCWANCRTCDYEWYEADPPMYNPDKNDLQ